MKLSMNNCHHPRVQHPFECARAGYASSVCLHHRSAVSVSLPINLSSALRLSAMVKAGLIRLAAITTELSPTSYPPVGVVKRALFQSSMSASGTLSLPEVDGSNKGNRNDEGSGIGNSGGVPIGGVLDRGARINVNGMADLIRAIDALVRGSIVGGGGGGSGVNINYGIRNGGNGYDVGETGDSGGVGIASNLSTSDSEWNGISICG
nr:hypothetical protein [Tanacetum cinerariifolium]